ncbi:IS66 family insertion sequence element accessory protein TnpB [Neorhizobium huautlense]|uniref:IS66 family insertion sequence element accessory protein TnpB n=1 Tax=Neorhizobium huautlense TaxID=67774 RepID=UPI0014760606
MLASEADGWRGLSFRDKRGERLKLLYFNSQGFCLFYKILQKVRLPWPSASDGTARLMSAQLAMLLLATIVKLRSFDEKILQDVFSLLSRIEEICGYGGMLRRKERRHAPLQSMANRTRMTASRNKAVLRSL